MSQDSYNPYSSPAVTEFKVKDPSQRPLADLGKRFLGSMIDGFIGIVFIGPGYALLIAGGILDDNTDPTNPLLLGGLGLSMLGFFALMGTQIYLMATRSQSIGKYLMNTQVVNYHTREPADFVSVFVLRSFVHGIIAGVPCFGAIYAIVDICYIFGDERRCLHDLLAQTSVVDLS